jgi:DNA-binding transcriptional ArsR family regulator
MTVAAFEAVADPTRRLLLDRLRTSGPMPLRRLAEGLPMSRQAVTKHLDLLRGAGLVRVERRGRERIHELEAAPLRDVAVWLAPYAAEWDARLARLATYLEETDDRSPNDRARRDRAHRPAVRRARARVARVDRSG